MSLFDNSELEEERRLCYVAITRAKKSLTVSYAEQRMLYGHTTTNRPSRFVQEIPAELTNLPTLRQQTAPKPFDGFGTRIEAYSDGAYPSRKENPKLKSGYRTYQKPASSAPAPDYRPGDMIRHTAFGRGMVVSVIKMGNDAMLEIAFDNVGTKRLMAKTASVHMQKVSG